MNRASGTRKGALARIVFAGAREFGARGITANLANPGPVNTCWMTDDVRDLLLAHTPTRLETPAAVPERVVIPTGTFVRWLRVRAAARWIERDLSRTICSRGYVALALARSRSKHCEERD